MECYRWCNVCGTLIFVQGKTDVNKCIRKSLCKGQSLQEKKNLYTSIDETHSKKPNYFLLQILNLEK